ncbi:threonyl/alanyl tRNA synthetase SAD [Halorubrum aidingense JCM 13560]|uniref:Threonyl/alanyl tRNA synthetase SAD n=1 Tax=Halorubrum aidingense JCM 13560 TaxID=1230454 RepID=M0PA33_9EURY|nr:alanine--tRNA ligase-related protein [Halorubrum aidingense]EMA66713.1 threonyl/alanyl tRNA synthetase SAD [Halorubrum aidingense JCM 13560]
MTASRAPAEPEVREFEATVERVDGREVVLDETYFYAESGGQPADRGTIDGALVDTVTERDGEVVHVLEEDSGPSLAPGETVTAIVDDAFRTYCTRAHTASHVLYGAARRTCEDLGYAGFDIAPEKVRVDLTTAEPLDDGDLVELERLANRAVWDSLPVSWETLTESEARGVDGIAFNTKTEEGAMSGGEAVRVVTIGDDGPDATPWDVAACGGTHVDNTAEIGPISVLARSNPGEGVTRVEFAVGPTAIDHDAAVHAAALSAATSLDTRIAELPDEIGRLREENDRLEAELRAATADLLAARLREFPTTEVDGATWAIDTVADAAPNDLREPAETVLAGGDGESAPDAIAAVGAGDAPFVVVAVGDPSAGIDAGAVVDAITDEFGGGGGGGPTFAQGGGLDADPDAIVSWLRER